MMVSWRWTVAALLLLHVPRGLSQTSGDGEFDSGSGSGFESLPAAWLQPQAAAAATALPLIPPPRSSLNRDGAATTTTTTTAPTPTTTPATSVPAPHRSQPMTNNSARLGGHPAPTLVTESLEAADGGRCAVSFSVAPAGPACPATRDARAAAGRELERARRVVTDYGRVLASVRDTVLNEAGEHGSFAAALRASLGALRAEHAEVELGAGKVEAAFEGQAADTSREREAEAKAAARMRLSLSQMSDSLLKASRLHASLEAALLGLSGAAREHGERLARLQGARTPAL